MQFYLNGYNPGDPDTSLRRRRRREATGGLPEAVDVLIVGSGPAERCWQRCFRLSRHQHG
jgi:phenol 2-monooxygenase